MVLMKKVLPKKYFEYLVADYDIGLVDNVVVRIEASAPHEADKIFNRFIMSVRKKGVRFE